MDYCEEKAKWPLLFFKNVYLWQNHTCQKCSMQGGAVLKSAHLGWKVKFYLHCQKDLATPKEEMTLGLRIRSFFFLSDFF